LREELSRLIDPSEIRHIGFSHFESDECGALNHWLELAPPRNPSGGLVGALVSVNDFCDPACSGVDAGRRAGNRLVPVSLPAHPACAHGWDAGVLFEESEKTLFCSDLFH
jgi:hypothetical protein